MTDLAIMGNVYLEFVDLDYNHLKYYELKVMKSDVGAFLVRHWGRIGTKGQFKIETFLYPGTARTRAIELLWEKRTKGYEVKKAVGFFEEEV